MPRRDGTGPEGKGPGTGRRRGNCFDYFVNKKGKVSIWRTLVIPALGALINDFRKPDGITRKAVKSISDHLKNKKTKSEEKKEIKEAKYEVIDDKEGE